MRAERQGTLPGLPSHNFAEFDLTLTYRYLLGRGTGRARHPAIPPFWLFLMLNPSKAGAEDDDPTIRRCRSFARAGGAARFEVVNFYAYIATDPRDLPEDEATAIGPKNDLFIDEAAERASLIVCAWGSKSGALGKRVTARAQAVMARLSHRPLNCLGLTKDGSPSHPLMPPASNVLLPYRPTPAR